MSNEKNIYQSICLRTERLLNYSTSNSLVPKYNLKHYYYEFLRRVKKFVSANSGNTVSAKLFNNGKLNYSYQY